MTVIYADTLFLLNAVIDYLLLLVSARIAGGPLRRLRMGAGAALGGLYAVGVFLPGFSFLARPAYKILFCLLMLLVAYGIGRELLRQSVLFFALAFALGGGIFAIGMLGQGGLSLGRGVVYSVPDLKMVLLSAAVCYAVLGTLLPKAGRHSGAGREIVPVRFELLGRGVELTALVDTGNTLTDPISGAAVPVAEGGAVLELFPARCGIQKEELADPAGALLRLEKSELAGRLQLLPYRAVGVERGMLLAVRMDRVKVAGRSRERCLVALSPTPVSDGGGYRVLMGGWFAS